MTNTAKMRTRARGIVGASGGAECQRDIRWVWIDLHRQTSTRALDQPYVYPEARETMHS